MRKAEGRHNQRLSTSWREIIFHSPRGIACLNGGRQSGSERKAPVLAAGRTPRIDPPGLDFHAAADWGQRLQCRA